MLENTYKIDPAFNKDLVLAYQPPPSINLSTLPTLPENWLDELQIIICAADLKVSQNCFKNHVGASSRYHSKKILREQLELIYHRLQGDLDSELGELSPNKRQDLICRLTEEIHSCTEGFHNRISFIVDSFQQPHNLDELLYIVRKRLVETVAIELSNEVHAWNHVSIIAAADGFGIKANLFEDRYSGKFSDSTIRRALQESISKYFTPILLPNLLITAFKEQIPELEFEKQSENGLCLQTIEKIKGLLKQFLPEFINENPKKSNDPNCWENYFEIEVDEKKPWLFKFVDISCEKIYKSFYYTLLNNNYFTKPVLKTLLENAYYNLFLNNSSVIISPEHIITKLLDEEQYYSLLLQLDEVKSKYPIFYNDNIFNNINIGTLFVKKCIPFNAFLKRQLMISEQYSKEIIQGFQLILQLSFLRKEYIIDEITNSLLAVNKAGFNLLMLGALNNPELVKNIFSFLKKHEAFMKPEIAEKMLLMKNSDHCNALMLAANKQKDAIITILGFLKTHIGRFANDTLYKLFTQQQKKDSYTALTLAARDNPDLLNTLLGFFTEHLRIDGDTFRRLFFPDNSKGTCTALMLAIKNQTDSSLLILRFIIKNIKSFECEVLRKMFVEKDENNYNILMLAARYHAKALTTLLDLLGERKLFPEEFLTSLFLEKNSQKYNFLMLAAKYQPHIITNILELFSNKKRKIFNPYLANLLLDKNDKGYNSLMLSHQHPEVMLSIITFIHQQPKKVISLTLPEIFLQKNAAGLNLLMLLAKDNVQSLNLFFEFIEKNPAHFGMEYLLKLVREKTLLGYNCLMVAARNQSATTVAILDFILKNPNTFSSTFVDQYIGAQSVNRANALMIAATYQPEVVKLLLDFLTKNAAPQGPIRIDTIRDIIFEKVHDKEAATAVFFGGRYGYYKSILLITSQLPDPTAVNALLSFIDHHIDSLGIESFIDLLTEQDYKDNYIFSLACSQCPDILKRTLNFIADSATDEALIPTHELCAKFIFTQLAQWTITTAADKELFYKVLEKCSAFLLTYFDKDFFAEKPHNLKRVTDKLFHCYLDELDDRKAKKINYTTGFSFFKWRYSTAQKMEAACALQNLILSNEINRKNAFSTLLYQYPAVGLCRLGKLFAAYQKIANIEVERIEDNMAFGITDAFFSHPKTAMIM